MSFQDLRASVHKVAAAHANSDVLLLLDNSVRDCIWLTYRSLYLVLLGALAQDG